MPLHFTQSCPTCGRRVQIRASLVGYSVVCQHCSAEFQACLTERRVDDFDQAGPHAGCADPLMERVEKALQRAAAQSSVA